jgi:hypothetical protein
MRRWPVGGWWPGSRAVGGEVWPATRRSGANDRTHTRWPETALRTQHDQHPRLVGAMECEVVCKNDMPSAPAPGRPGTTSRPRASLRRYGQRAPAGRNGDALVAKVSAGAPRPCPRLWDRRRTYAQVELRGAIAPGRFGCLTVRCSSSALLLGDGDPPLVLPHALPRPVRRRGSSRPRSEQQH